ncbi:hypothetical protein ACWCQQ_21870 [Streptomyces sp. NPDC002143]
MGDGDQAGGMAVGEGDFGRRVRRHLTALQQVQRRLGRRGCRGEGGWACGAVVGGVGAWAEMSDARRVAAIVCRWSRAAAYFSAMPVSDLKYLAAQGGSRRSRSGCRLPGLWGRISGVQGAQTCCAWWGREGAAIYSVVVNVLVGLVTSLIGGGFVWLWERGKRSRVLQRKADFFGLVPRETCFIVIGNKYNAREVATHKEIRAMIEVATLAGQLGCDVATESSDEFRGSNDNRTEFCIGGPLGEANLRTRGHLAAHLRGVSILPHSTGPESAAFVVGGRRYLFQHDEVEYALVAKFTPPEATRPVVLICGQSSLANQAAIHYLKRHHRQVADSLDSTDRYCLMLKVADIGTYGFQGTSFERDVTRDAFAAP